MAKSSDPPETETFAEGGYRYIPGVFQYSAGVAALDGFEIRRIRFQKPVSVKEGFARIKDILADYKRPLTSFCACELRSPAQFSEEGFRAFNETYVATLESWGIYDGQTNPVARSNVCPEVNGPTEPQFYAFSFTLEAERAKPSFVVAGSGEAPEGHNNYRDHIVRLGDISPGAIEDKASFVLGEMERRLSGLGFDWSAVTATQLYTVHNIHHFLQQGIEQRGATPAGLTWHYARPPIVGLEFEMDCRGIPIETVI
ncbi:MAG: hypothetical protein AAGD43_01750 [Pseudomonadota bacterium]